MNGDRKKIEKYLEKWKCRIRKTQTTYRRNWVGKGWNTHNNQVVFMCQSSSWFHGSGNHSDCFANIAVLLKVVSQKNASKILSNTMNTKLEHDTSPWIGNSLIYEVIWKSCDLVLLFLVVFYDPLNQASKQASQ